MKNTMKRLLCLLLALCMCAGLAIGAAAEDEEEEEPSAVTPTGIKIDDPDTDVLYVGQSLDLSCTILPSDFTGTVIWSSSDEAAAPVDTSGKVRALSASETVDITATVDGCPDITATLTLAVKDDGIKSYTLEGGGITGGDGSYRLSLSGTASFTLTGTAEYDSGATKSGANWSIDEPGMDVLSFTSKGEFTVIGPGNAVITAEFPEDTEKTATVNVHVDDAPLTGLTISGTNVSGGKATLAVGATLALSAKKQPENTFNNNAVTWRSSDPSVATVDESTGVVTAVKGGKDVTITASCMEGGKAVEAAITVKVGDPTADISASTTRSRDLTFSGIYSELSDKFTSACGKPSDSATIRFGTLGSSTYGVLYTKSSANTKVASGKDYNFSDVRSMYFVPGSVGRYEMTYTLTDSGKTLTGKITVTVTGSKSRDITIRLKDGSPYAFNSSSNLDKVSAVSIINTAIKDASGSSYSYIVFKSPSSSSSKIGTLYPDSSKKYDLDDYNSYCAGSSGGSKQKPVSSLYFDPKKEGTYSIGYTAYDSKDIELCSGSLIIEVGATSDATVTVTLDGSGRYTFSEKTKTDKISAAAAIDDAIRNKTDKTYSYIRFGSIVSGSSVGTLYADSDMTAIKTTTKYSRSSSSGYNVSGLCFVPEKPGTYVRSFTAYSSSDGELLTGELKIVVPSGGSGNDMDIYFNTTSGSTLSLNENVFESWFRQEKGSNYNLAYVTFDNVSRSFGSFKHSGSSFTPGNDVRYYAQAFTGSTGSSPKYLDNVNYTAPGSTGYLRVDFTCCGGTSSSGASTRASGAFYIFVTKDSVKGITRDVTYGSAVTLSESEFSTVHKNAMSLGSTSSPRYYIELLEVPSRGTLYYNYTSASKPGTRLSSSNFDSYDFYVNSASSYDSVSDLTYMPANASSGSVSLRYLARATDGEPMYVGSVSFSYGKQQGASLSCGADGYTFKTSDFSSGSGSDPVAYVTFSQPKTGELMLGYANGRGVPLDSSVRLYTSNYTDGSYPVSSLSYIPKAGFSGNVDIAYTAVTKAGKAQSGVLTMAVSSRKGSAHFRDVQSTGSGAWASDAIDYAYKWGLVNGTGEDTFSPDSTMTRAMLVTILYRSAGSPKVSGGCPFNDVPAGAYYYDAVIWAANNGIVTGTSATTFSPDRDVNREQVAAFLHRYAKYNGENVTVTGTLNGYSDKSFVSQYAIEPMSWAVQHGYITSTSGEQLLLSPGGSATRAQVAVMLHRFLTY